MIPTRVIFQHLKDVNKPLEDVWVEVDEFDKLSTEQVTKVAQITESARKISKKLADWFKEV